MKTVLYYYTATGNSLMIARAIAEALGDTDLVPLARYRMDPAAPAAERVGIIFPIHAWGPPRTVSEFVQGLDLKGVRYTFAVASCGGTAAGTLPRLQKALRRNGGELHAGFIVRSAGYMDTGGKQPPMIELVRRLSGPLFPTDRERLPEIIEAVRNEWRMKPESNAFLGSMLGNFFHRMAEKQFPRMDNGYIAGEACEACGQCGRICPRGNVHLLNGRPAWSHDCDFCGACATWCAQHAIGFKGMPASTPRKHHPSVVAADLIWT